MTTTNPVHHNAPNLSAVGAWSWQQPRSPAHYRTCNYCGCIHPEDLVAEPNWKPEWADQKYGWPHKFYIDIPDRHGELDWLGGSNRDMTDEDLAAYPGWKRVSDTPDELAVVVAKQRPGQEIWEKVVHIAPRGSHHAKFYTEHLADPDISEITKAAIHQRGGLVFDWLPDGRVSWHPFGSPAAPAADR